MERALEHAFAKALEQMVHDQAEAVFQKAFANGSPLSQKLQEKMAEVLQRFLEEGVGKRRSPASRSELPARES